MCPAVGWARPAQRQTPLIPKKGVPRAGWGKQCAGRLGAQFCLCACFVYLFGFSGSVTSWLSNPVTLMSWILDPGFPIRKISNYNSEVLVTAKNSFFQRKPEKQRRAAILLAAGSTALLCAPDNRTSQSLSGHQKGCYVMPPTPQEKPWGQ